MSLLFKTQHLKAMYSEVLSSLIQYVSILPDSVIEDDAAHANTGTVASADQELFSYSGESDGWHTWERT